MNSVRCALALIALSAASAQSPKKPPPPQGVVHIYRLKLEIGTVTRPTVTCDNFPVVRIPNGSVFTMKMSVGRHAIAIDNEPGSKLDVVADKEHYVRIDYAVNASHAGGAVPVVVPPEQGRMETMKLKQLDPGYIESATCGS